MYTGIDSQVSQRMDQFRGNPDGLMQQYQQNQQLIDLLALQKLKSEKEAAARDMQMKMQQNPQTIAQQREQEVQQMTQQEVAQQMGQSAPSVAQNMQQDQARQMVKQGIGGLPAPNVQGMARGGIVSFSGGGSVGMPGEGALIPLMEEAKRIAAETGENAKAVFNRLVENMQARMAQVAPATGEARNRPDIPFDAVGERIGENYRQLGEDWRTAGNVASDAVGDIIPQNAEEAGALLRSGTDGIGSLANNYSGMWNKGLRKGMETASDFSRGFAGGDNRISEMLTNASDYIDPSRHARETSATQGSTPSPTQRNYVERPADIPAEYGGQGGASGILAAAQQGLPKGPDNPPAAGTSTAVSQDSDGIQHEVIEGPEDLIMKMGRGDTSAMQTAFDDEYTRAQEVYGGEELKYPDEKEQRRRRLIQAALSAGGATTNLGALTRMVGTNMTLTEDQEQELRAIQERARLNKVSAYEAASGRADKVADMQRSASSALAAMVRTSQAQGQPAEPDQYQKIAAFLRSPDGLATPEGLEFNKYWKTYLSAKNDAEAQDAVIAMNGIIQKVLTGDLAIGNTGG